MLRLSRRRLPPSTQARTQRQSTGPGPCERLQPASTAPAYLNAYLQRLLATPTDPTPRSPSDRHLARKRVGSPARPQWHAGAGVTAHALRHMTQMTQVAARSLPGAAACSRGDARDRGHRAVHACQRGRGTVEKVMSCGVSCSMSAGYWSCDKSLPSSAACPSCRASSAPEDVGRRKSVCAPPPPLSCQCQSPHSGRAAQGQ